MTSVRVCYQTIEFGKTDIHLRTLRNTQEFHDPDGEAQDVGINSTTWPLFGVVWAAGELLARLMYDYNIKELRILEVGCGIGLASMVLNHRLADITATDHNPAAMTFMAENVKLNKGDAIPFVCTDWANKNNQLGKFDLIIGSDLLYERDHAKLLSDFIDQHALPHCKVILIDPGRGHQSKFSKNMIDLGYSHTRTPPQKIEGLTQPMRNVTSFHILHYDR
jgi:ETFB lysine methyltransferase